MKKKISILSFLVLLTHLCLAQIEKDGIDYVIYKIEKDIETPLLYFYTALQDKKYPDQTFWGYPWDIKNIRIDSNKKLLVSIENDYESDGNITIPKNQNQLPYLYFNGTTTQPEFRLNKINNPKRMSFENVLKLVIQEPEITKNIEPKPVFSIEEDINQDEHKDKIVVYENEKGTDEFEKSHFALPMEIFKGTISGFQLWKKNDRIIYDAISNCISEGFSRIVVKDNYFTIETQTCYDYNIVVSSYITFKVINDKIILHKYGESYFDKKDHDRKIPTKIWTSKDFGEVRFEDVDTEILLNLRNK